jgi:uncharacterized protein YpmS
MPSIDVPETVTEVVDEKSGVHFIVPPKATLNGQRAWKWAALVLTTLLAAGGILGVFGRAFYVSRSEYTVQAQSDAVSRESMRGTLERLDKTMISQAEAFRELTMEVYNVKTDLAVLKKK